MDDYFILRSNYSRSHQTRLDYLHLIHSRIIWISQFMIAIWFPFRFQFLLMHLPFLYPNIFLILGFWNYDPNIAYFEVCFGNSGRNKENVLVCVDPKYKKSTVNLFCQIQVFVYVVDLEILITTHLMALLFISWEHVNILCGSRPYRTIDVTLGLRQRTKDVMETTRLHGQGS